MKDFLQSLSLGSTAAIAASVLSIVVSTGCRQAINSQILEGCWEYESPSEHATWTYFNDHTWTMIATGATNCVLNGTWLLDGSKLFSVTLESSLEQNLAPQEETVEIVRLDSIGMTVKSKSGNGVVRNIKFRRKLPPDADFNENVPGTWQFAMTNSRNGEWVTLMSTYQRDGTALWDGVMHLEARTQSIRGTGVWRVEHGFLCTVATNSTGDLTEGVPLNKLCRDQILDVDSIQLSYLNRSGKTNTVKRVTH